MEKEKKPFYKKWWFIVLVAMFIFALLGNLLESDESKQERKDEQIAAEQEKEEEKNKKAEEEKAEEERKANRSINEAIEEDNDSVDKATLEDGILTLEAEGKTTFSENTLFLSVYDMFEAMNEGFQDDSVNEVYIELTTTMIDQKGNESVEPVIKYNYSRESFEELNYDNFSNMAYSEQWRILREADYYYIHPGIYKNLKDEYKDNLSVEGFN